MSQRLPAVLSHHDLPQAELNAALLDGEVYAVDECFSPIDEIDQRSHRALALASLLPERLLPEPLLPERLIAEQRTAAWVLGALARPPFHHQFCAAIDARVRPSGMIRVTVREVVIDETDLLECAGLRVTTPLRTVVDLARFSPSFGDEEVRLVKNLMSLGGFGVEECKAMLDRRQNLPAKRLAHQRILAAVARIYPPETLYTSYTASMRRTAFSTPARWVVSPISKTKRLRATRSLDVDTVAERMLT